MDYGMPNTESVRDEVVVLDPDDPEFGLDDHRAPARDSAELAKRSPARRSMNAYALDDALSRIGLVEPTIRRRPWQISFPYHLIDDRESHEAHAVGRSRTREKKREIRSASSREGDAHSFPATDNALMTTAEVAAYLRVSTATVLRHIASRRLRSVRAGKHSHHRFRRSDVDALLASCRPEETPAEDLSSFIRRKTG